jgi:hypothetical protein
MRKLQSATLSLFLAATAAVTAACAGSGEAPSADAGWRPLFDGNTLAGWTNPYDWGDATVEGGEIRLVGDRKFFLVTEEEFDDFVFEGEVLLPDTMSNAGFMFRANVEENRVYGYQAEVDPKARRWAGGLYDEGRRGWLVPAAGEEAAATAFRQGPGTAFQPTEWNRYRIEAVGDSLKIWVNEVLTAAYRDTVDAAGPIGLQHHGEDGKVYRYRNLRIREVQ